LLDELGAMDPPQRRQWPQLWGARLSPGRPTVDTRFVHSGCWPTSSTPT